MSIGMVGDYIKVGHFLLTFTRLYHLIFPNTCRVCLIPMLHYYGILFLDCMYSFLDKIKRSVTICISILQLILQKCAIDV